MRVIKLLALIFTYLCGATLNLAASDPSKLIKLRVASYNVEFSKSATPEQIGEMFKSYNLDIIGFDEAPDGDWTARVGKALGMKYCYVGKISSANHKDKYKSILSRTPFEVTSEHELNVNRGWNPASAVRVVTEVDGVLIAFYSLHISGFKERKRGKKLNIEDSHAYKIATEILPKETIERIIVVGDFNNNIGDLAMNTIEAAGMSPTWKDLKINLSKEFTYNAQDPKKNLGVIDHILYNMASGAKAIDGGIIELEKPLSDHKPIWAEILFPRKLKKAKGVEKMGKTNEPKE